MPLAESLLVRLFLNTGRAIAKFWWWSVTWDQRWKNRKGIIVGESKFERSSKRLWMTPTAILGIGLSLWFGFRSR